jgi:uncharacterized protein HemX
MADTREQSSAGGIVLLAAAAGAVAGAAGLAAWLLRRAERRHLEQRQLRMLRVSRLAEASGEPVGRDQLHDRVQKLNQAIDEVRRQLEQLQPQP